MFRVKGMMKESREYHEKLIGKVASRDIGAGIILAAVYSSGACDALLSHWESRRLRR